MKNLSPIISIVAGVIVLIKPEILAIVVGIFLIVSGILGFLGRK